jgi:ribonuclease J
VSLTLTVHRGSRQIGGSCIEIAHPGGQRLILDAGRPLDAPEGATGLLPASLDTSHPATVLISHPHQDHWGLVEELPPDWPIWTGSGAAKLIAVTGNVTRRPLARRFETWDSRARTLTIGPFSVTPILTDHSAFDAYMLLVEGAGKRLLYTGDFRRHGRKSALVDRIMVDPPRNIGVLLTEGTNLGSDKPVKSERELEDEFSDLFQRTKGRVFIAWSAQNIDRTVTIYRAAKRTGRTLVIDLYSADVLDRVSEGTGVPRIGFPNLKAVITSGLRKFYVQQGWQSFVERMAAHGIAARQLNGGRHVVMLRRALIRDYERADVAPTADDAFNFSMWRGYLSDPYHAAPLEWCEAKGAEIAYIHTSGHASAADLRAFALSVRPRLVVPVHGVNWDSESHGFGAICRLPDGQPMTLQ